ncbi:ATP-grasp domain-containing protein [Oceanobacillus saliphilus]|uniref:ATP-grasp domain-containing protein n=1 Tax=Oceanobacillus saliphilus TaxID=2925834 RepID=UPI00201D8B89|nr:ATP-grasp domain-containing protein [Oceanobacillus saliphilus]
MSQKTVFLTGAGGTAIPILIKRLKQKGFKVLAGDMDDFAVGLYLADKGFILPKGQSPEFLPTIKRICKDESVDAVIPLVDEELLSAIELEKENIPVLLPQKSFINLCLDKSMLMKKLAEHHISVPKTKLASEGCRDLIFPIIAKPRVGRGSRGVKFLASEEEFNSYVNRINQPSSIILQEYIDGKEFTVSVIVWRDGSVQGVVPKEIIQKQGVTKIAVSRRNRKIEDICLDIQEKLIADGPFNVQLRLNENGEPFIFEINPRFSTSISLTMACGIDELNIILNQALTGKVKTNPIEWKEGIVLLRQTLDEFITEEEFKSHQNNIFGGSN